MAETLLFLGAANAQRLAIRRITPLHSAQMVLEGLRFSAV